MRRRMRRKLVMGRRRCGAERHMLCLLSLSEL
jgi:hypothetical protein